MGINVTLCALQVPVEKKVKKPTVVASKKQDVTGADDPVSTSEIQPKPILSQPEQVAANPNVAPPSGVHTRSGAGAGSQSGPQTLT